MQARKWGKMAAVFATTKGTGVPKASIDQIIGNIDTQLNELEHKLDQCQRQLRDCDSDKQPFLEREIDALKSTRSKLTKSRTLALRAHSLSQPHRAPMDRRTLWRIGLILLLAVAAAAATLILL